MTHNAKEDKIGIITLFPQNSEKNPLIQVIKRLERESATWTIFSKKWSATFVYNATLATRPIPRFPIKKSIIYKPIVTMGYSRITNLTLFGLFCRKLRPLFSEKIGESKTESKVQRPILNKQKKKGNRTLNVFIKKYMDIRFPSNIICR